MPLLRLYPALHVVHLLVPDAEHAAQLASPQIWQEALPVEDHVPALQLEHPLDPAELHFPAVQLTHIGEPSTALYFPAAQGVHEEAPAEDHVPALQSRHEELAMAPDCVDHVPAMQLIQVTVGAGVLL